MPFCVGLAEDTAQNLLYIHFGGFVGQRGQNVRKGAVSPLLEGINRDNVSDGTILAHEIRFPQLVHLGGLDRDFLFGNPHIYMTTAANKFLRIYYGTVTAYLEKLQRIINADFQSNSMGV